MDAATALKLWCLGMLSFDELVVIGCGGVWYHAQSVVRVLMRTAKSVVFVDPDKLEMKNGSRQWPERRLGMAKGLAATSAWDPEGLSVIPGALDGKSSDLLEKYTDKLLPNVVVIASPDNDQARLDATEIAAKVKGIGVVLVAGNDATSGQCYWGVAAGGRWVYDWREAHAEVVKVANGERAETVCGDQHVLANQYTGALIGRALQSALTGGVPKGEEKFPSEEFWFVDGNNSPDRIGMFRHLVTVNLGDRVKAVLADLKAEPKKGQVRRARRVQAGSVEKSAVGGQEPSEGNQGFEVVGQSEG